MQCIKLSENNLKDIIKESINTILNDFGVKRNANFDNPISRKMKLPLSEGLIKTYPLGKTINYIKNYFKISDDDIYPIDGENGREQIAIKVPIIGNNLELVKKAFALCGYYLGYPKEENLKQNTIYELQFEKNMMIIFQKCLESTKQYYII